jgi:hypothetical protein
MASIDGSSTSITRSYPDDSDELGEPRARGRALRARIPSSDVDMHYYTAHVSPYFFPSVRCYARADLACLFPTDVVHYSPIMIQASTCSTMVNL